MTLARARRTTADPDHRSVVISNGSIRATIYVPDPERGFYRSTRFDWSGIVASLECAGHEYYGPWFTASEPGVRDFVYRGDDIVAGPESSIVGPAEEFPQPQGFEHARAGGTFVKVGVGVLRTSGAEPYSPFDTYELVDSGEWSVKVAPEAVTFTQTLNDVESGYGYVYRKTLRLAEGLADMAIEHSLRNTGRQPIETTQYNHNFLVLDGAATGPDVVLSCPFPIDTPRPPDPSLAVIRGKEIHYTRTLEAEERVTCSIEGFGPSAADYDVRVENRKTGAGLRITSDRPLARVMLWSIRSVLSIEPFVDVSTAPGSTTDWTYTYSYYTLS